MTNSVARPVRIVFTTKAKYVVQEADGSVVPFNESGYRDVASLAQAVRRNGYFLTITDRMGASEFDATLRFGNVHNTTRHSVMDRMAEYEASRVPAPAAPVMAMPAPLPCHLIPTPSGRFTFVGRVPTDLAFEASSPDYVATALQCGPGLAQKQAAREGGTFRSLSWASEAEAYAFAADHGYAVPASAVAALDDETQEGLILRRYITTAIAAGYALSVHDGGCVTVRRSQDARAVFSALRTTCEDRLIYARRVGDAWQTVGSVLFVYGNSPWEVAADASTSLDDVTAEADAYAASFEPQAPAMVPQPAQQQQAQDMRDCGQVPSIITLPTHWAGFLIYGDAIGLDDGEEDRIAAHLKAELPDDAAIVDVVEGTERFTWSYRLYGGDASGGDVADFTVLRPGARAAVQRAGATA